jgi:hypothetical protein
MAYIKATLRDGTTLSGEVWTWRPQDGWFALISDEPGPIQLDAVVNGTITSRFTIKGEETRDLLEHARSCGWES